MGICNVGLCSVDNIKKMFIIIAYCSYVVMTAIQNQMEIQLGNYNYIFCAVIGVCLKLSQSTTVIEKIINSIDNTVIDEIKNQLNSIGNDIKTNSINNTDRSIRISGRVNNEPIDTNIIYLDDLINNRKITRDDFVIEIVSDSKEPTPRI
jgi:uncharacterized protein YllA (UPF0747 family)